MAVIKTWEVNTCERDLSDGYITKVIYRLKATEDNVEIEGTRMTGEVTFTNLHHYLLILYLMTHQQKHQMLQQF